MNALFLQDLADKTRRGLRGHVEAGTSGGGNSYGYRVVRRLDATGDHITGEREIVEAEASVIRRIFREFSAGKSPRARWQNISTPKTSRASGVGVDGHCDLWKRQARQWRPES